MLIDFLKAPEKELITPESLLLPFTPIKCPVFAAGLVTVFVLFLLGKVFMIISHGGQIVLLGMFIIIDV